MTTADIIREKEAFIYDSMVNRTGLYDFLFASLLYKINDICWARYFMEHFSFMKNNTTVLTNYKESYYCEGKMYVNHTEASIGISIIVHEYGHYVFDKMLDKKEKEEEIILNLFKKEAEHLIEDRRFLVKLYEKYCSHLNWIRVCEDREFCPLMLTDGITILSKKSYTGLHHNSNYPIEYLASELFAECLEAEVLGYKYPFAIYKGECPQTYSYIRKKIYEVLKP